MVRNGSFTKEELFEIEKMFDILAGQTIVGMSTVLNNLSSVGIKAESEIIHNIVDDNQKSYMLCKSISTKSSRMRLELENQKINNEEVINNK